MIAPAEGFNNPQEKSPIWHLPLLFIGFVLFQFAFRYPYLVTFSYVNEDASLIRLAVSSHQKYGLTYWFLHSYGPGVLRPLQLLGLALQDALFSGSSFAFHTFSIFVLALAQTVLTAALRPFVGVVAAVLAVIVAGTAQVAAEPIFWISDQHDLYLFLFSALSTFMYSRIVRSIGSNPWNLLLLFVFYWGAFFSNEKAVALPVLLSLFTLLAGIRIFVRVSTIGVLSLLSYFAYRYAALGVFVGGYSSGLFPHKLTFSFVWKTLLSVFTTPFRLYSMSASTLSGIVGLGLMFVLLILVLRERESWKRDLVVWGGLFVSVLLFSAAPVFSYLLPYHSHHMFSTRLHWLILLSYIPFFAVLFSAVLKLSSMRPIGVSLVLMLLLQIGAGGRGEVRKFSRASRFSDRALELYLQECRCAKPEAPQTTGLPEIFAGAHVFSEGVWIEENALYHGLPRCQREESGCALRFRRNRKGKLLVKSLAD